MASWKVLITKKAEKELKSLINDGTLTVEDQNIIVAWIRDIMNNGIENIVDSRKWNDHSLQGKWSGFRSSSFSFKGRIIYKIREKKVYVEVVRITTDHDYS